jgi:hypothetical protein
MFNTDAKYSRTQHKSLGGKSEADSENISMYFRREKYHAVYNIQYKALNRGLEIEKSQHTFVT